MDEFGVRLVPIPWNKGKLVGQKTPLKLKEIWAIRVRLQVFGRTRELALFDLGIDSKLRACDLLKLKVRDVSHGDRVASRAIVVQQKTLRPVQFEITRRHGPLWPTGSDCRVSCLIMARRSSLLLGRISRSRRFCPTSREKRRSGHGYR
jgi:hypothetical protein